MIELINVTKYYLTDLGRHYVLRDVSLQIPRDINVAIIGANGAGKSTMLRLLAGVDTPNSGRIVRTGRISWPMGLTPGVQAALNGVENARFACRIYGLSSDEIRLTIEKVREIADIGKHFELPVNTYSSGMRQRLSFAISMSLDFDYYLFDEIGAGGDRAFKKLANELIEKRLSSANFIMVSHNPGDVVDLCQAAILLREGTVTYFDDVRKALVEYGESDFVEKRGRSSRSRRSSKQSGGDGTEAPAPAGAADSAGSKREKRLEAEKKKALNAAARAEKREHRQKLKDSKKKARAAKSSGRSALGRNPEPLPPVAVAGPAAVADPPVPAPDPAPDELSSGSQERRVQRQEALRQKRLRRQAGAELAGQPSVAVASRSATAADKELRLARRRKKRRAAGRLRPRNPRPAGPAAAALDESGVPLANSAAAYSGVEELAERWAARRKSAAPQSEPEPATPAVAIGSPPRSAGK